MLDLLRRWIGRATLGVAAALVLWVFALILWGVVMRYAFGAAPVWLAEVARFSIIAVTMLAMGAVWAAGGHMRVGLLESLVPARLGRAIVVYQWLLSLAVAAAMGWYAYAYVGSVAFFTTQALRISRAVPVALMPLGFGLLFLQILLHGPRPLAQPHEAAQ